MATIICGKCLFCDRPLEQSLKGRDKKFCDKTCRDAYQPYRQDEEASNGLGR